jgi:hypothetical protein
MFFLGKYPWECLTCQKRFFDSLRYSQGKRHPNGEVYIKSKAAPGMRNSVEENPSS